MNPTNEQAIAGQAVYTRKALSIYDIVVLGISNRWIWKCPTSELERLYSQNLSSNHLDVGVGTGYFLDRCHFPSSSPRIALMDMNANSLSFASERIARYSPEVYRRNILESIETPLEPFDSVAVNYLLHCIPGAIGGKAVVFDHLKVIASPGARIFGSTILQGGVPRSWAAQRLMALYNKKGIFSNTQDNLGELETVLTQRFDKVQLEVVGCVALFSGEFR